MSDEAAPVLPERERDPARMTHPAQGMALTVAQEDIVQALGQKDLALIAAQNQIRALQGKIQEAVAEIERLQALVGEAAKDKPE